LTQHAVSARFTRQPETSVFNPALLLSVLLLTACAAPSRLSAPPTVVTTQAPTGFSAEVRQVGIDSPRTISAVDRWLREVAPTVGDAPLRLLALSGGGAGSAFGAGALVGMSRARTRPQFDLVTGISAGALLAPFAFLGPDWDAELTAAFDGGAAAHLLRRRGLGSLIHPGIFKGEPLVELVDRFVTDRLIRAVTAQAATGRTLLVATTDLDKEESVIWDMGKIAAHGGEAARTLFRDVLVASASIPGVFPPVIIRVGDGDESFDELHVDGGTTTPFFVTPEAGLFGLQPHERLRRAQIYVVVNGQLGVVATTTKVRPIAIVSRSFSAALMHSSRKSLELIAGLSQRFDMDLRFSSIPVTFPYQGPLGFDPDTMHALFEYGAHCAESGRFWMTVPAALERGRELASSGAIQSQECPSGGLGETASVTDPTKR